MQDMFRGAGLVQQPLHATKKKLGNREGKGHVHRHTTHSTIEMKLPLRWLPLRWLQDLPLGWLQDLSTAQKGKEAEEEKWGMVGKTTPISNRNAARGREVTFLLERPFKVKEKA